MRLLASLTAMMVLAMSNPAGAHTGSSGLHCISCHTTANANGLTIKNTEMYLSDPVETSGKPDQGQLPTIDVVKGTTVQLKIDIGSLAAGKGYAATLWEFKASTGVTNNQVLQYTPDATGAWALNTWHATNEWYVTPNYVYGTSSPKTFTYNLYIKPTAVVGYYLLGFDMATGTTTVPETSDEQMFYLHVVTALPVLGDINRDGAVNTLDLLAVAGSWAKRTGDSGFDARCDLNGDAGVDVVDLLLLADNWGT